MVEGKQLTCRLWKTNFVMRTDAESPVARGFLLEMVS
jgi:hypothetical protein